MTRYSLPSEFRIGSDRVGQLVATARAVLAFERLWPALWPATGIVGVGVAAALFGAFEPLPWPLHALILASFVTAIALALYFNLGGFSWPRWEEGARRLERDSALTHRPISEAKDALAAGAGDPDAEALWRAHIAARLKRLYPLRLKPPRSALGARDPRALRFVVLLLIGLGALAAGSDWSRRLEGVFSPNAGAIATLDAWIDPPAYTGETPVYLGRQGTLAVPAGSVLNLRVHGADHRPSVTTDGVRFDGGEGEYVASTKLTEDGRIRVRADGHTVGSWKIKLIPDAKPAIAFAAKPAATERQALKITYTTSDDYGIAAVRAIIRPHGRNGAPVVLDLEVPDRSAKSTTQTAFRDLTEHPYAGLDVDITLLAVDGAGQTAISDTVVFRLPQRIFTDPLARALIEQRQNLASAGTPMRERVRQTLEALTVGPEYFYADREGAYLALRAAFWALTNAHNNEDIDRVQTLLWQTAVGLEQGGLLNMAAQLRRLQQMLAQAMARGAPQDEIEALLERYHDLMRQYLTALAQHAPENGTPDANARMLGMDELDDLLKAIQTLSQSGDRLKAMQLLAMLEALLENLQVAQDGGAGGSGAGEQALRDLGDIMGRQRMLLDKTFREDQGTGDPRDGGAKGLARQQGDLRGALGKLRNGLGGKKDPKQNLNDADRLMGEAEQALGQSDFLRASGLQKQVLEALRKSADALAQAMGQGRQQNNGQDPLGRASEQGRGSGDLRIPDASVLQHARDILMELRRRAGQQGRPKEELDYIDRLLKQF